jgi:hypothetical protein
MKKTLLGLAFVAALITVSCKTETKDEMKEATEAVGAEMDEAIDTAAVKVDAAVDSTKAKVGETLEKGAAKMDEAGKKMKEAATH